MMSYEIYATIGTGKWNKGRYEYIGKTPVVPQRNAIINNLRAEGRDVKVVTKYPNGSCNISEYYAVRQAE